MTDLRKWSDEQLKATLARLQSERDSAAATAQQMRKRETELRERAESDREARLEAQRTVDNAVTAEREVSGRAVLAAAQATEARQRRGHAGQARERLDADVIAAALRDALARMKCGAVRGGAMPDTGLEKIAVEAASSFEARVDEHWSARVAEAHDEVAAAENAERELRDELTSARLDVDAAHERRDALAAGAGSLSRDLRETVTEAELAEAKIRAADNTLRAIDAEIQRRGSHAAKAS